MTSVHGFNTDDTLAEWDSVILGCIERKRSNPKIKAHTTEWYDYLLRSFKKWLRTAPVPVGEFRKAHYEAYLAARSKSVQPTTVRHSAEAIQQVLAYMVDEGLTERGWVRDILLPPAKRKARHTPSVETLNKVIAAVEEFYSLTHNPDMKYVRAKARPVYKRRNKALLLLCRDTGARISEVLSAKLADYHPKSTISGSAPAISVINPTISTETRYYAQKLHYSASIFYCATV